MVQIEELRLAFSERLRKALAEKDIPQWGAGARLAKIAGVTPKAASKWLNGEAIPGAAKMLIVAQALGVRVEWLQHGSGAVPGPIPGSDTPAANTPLPAGGEPAIDLDEHYAFVPQLTAKAAAGLGYENAHIESRSTLAFKREWLRFRGASEKHLVVIYADGESMWPTINSGDVLLVDKSKIDPAHQQVFVLGNSEGVIVKRLVQSPTGAWIIRSDNEDKDAYPDLALLRRDEDEHRIIGQVIWRGGDL